MVRQTGSDGTAIVQPLSGSNSGAGDGQADVFAVVTSSVERGVLIAALHAGRARLDAASWLRASNNADRRARCSTSSWMRGRCCTQVCSCARQSGLSQRPSLTSPLRIRRGNSLRNLAPAAVAEICGTSITQIDKTYYHTTREKMISNAMADYYYNKDGLLVPK